MSVLATTSILREMFAGYEDPALPEGTWRGETAITGDASGGIMSAAILFNEGTGVARDARYYSLEMINCFTDGNASRAMALSVIAMGGFAARSYLIDALVFNTTDALQDPRSLEFLPTWLGNQNAEGSSTNIQLVLNNLNGETMTFIAMGYLWGPRSINAEGGPSRPLQGRF